MNNLSHFTTTLLATTHRLQDKGFITHAQDSVSLLLPNEDVMLLWSEQKFEVLPLADALLGVAAIHTTCYRQRPDVGAVALLSPTWSLLQHQEGYPLRTLFDEQARHIGRPWQSKNTLKTKLATGGNAGMNDGQLLVLGVTPRRMLFNAELYEKCAKAATLAHATHMPVHTLPWWVRRIAESRLRADQKRSAASHQAGQEAEELQAY